MTSHEDLRHRMPAHGRAPAWLATWLGIFALYVQLAAAAACLSGTTQPDLQAAGASVFPICHGHASDDGAPGAPQSTPCPICAFHSHAAAALPPPAEVVASPGAFVATTPVRPEIVASREGRVLLAAAPRGPPAA